MSRRYSSTCEATNVGGKRAGEPCMYAAARGRKYCTNHGKVFGGNPPREDQPPTNTRKETGRAYSGAFLFPCSLSADCDGVLLWEDYVQPDGFTRADVMCSECGATLDGADVLAALGSIAQRQPSP